MKIKLPHIYHVGNSEGYFITAAQVEQIVEALKDGKSAIESEYQTYLNPSPADKQIKALAILIEEEK